MAWAVEYTDTFGGGANYSWVRRATIGARKGESCRSVMRRAKAAVGITGLRGRTEANGRYPDHIEFRPYRMATVLFVTWSDWRNEDSAADLAEARHNGRKRRGAEATA